MEAYFSWLGEYSFNSGFHYRIGASIRGTFGDFRLRWAEFRETLDLKDEEAAPQEEASW